MIRTREDKANQIESVFNTDNGNYIRITEGDPKFPDAFMSSMPELIDIGIMGRCDRGCEYCYQDAKPDGTNMTLEDYKSIMEQVHEDVYQVALGGAGNVNEHESFEEIIRTTREDFNIVPSYTTNGDDLTDEQIAASKKYCGAVAVSKHEGDNWETAVMRLLDAGVKTNIHFILSEDTISDAVEMLSKPELWIPEGLNAVVFLLYKPFGRGAGDAVLESSEEFDIFCELVKNWKGSFKLGFDSCSAPFLIDREIANPNVMDFCEGSRYSCYINANSIMTPCSFDVDNKYGVSLKFASVRDVWNSEKFEQFREGMRNNGCKCDSAKQINCMGGCPLTQDIVICGDEGRVVRDVLV